MDALLPILGQFGLPGIVIFALFWAVKTLYERNRELQDKRVEDLGSLKDVMYESSGALKEQTRTLEGLSDLIKQQRGGKS